MPTVLFLGSPTPSFTDPDVREASLNFPYFIPKPVYVGKAIEFGDGDGINRTRYRYSIEATSKGVPRSASLNEIDFGRALYLVERVLAMEHVWIIQVYEGEFLSGPPAFRSVYDRSDPDGSGTTDHFWYYSAAQPDLSGNDYPIDTTSGTLPMKMRVIDQPGWETLSGGRIALSINLLSATIYSSHT